MSTDKSALTRQLYSRDFLSLVAHFALLSVYVAIVLALTDKALHLLLPDYQYSGRYGFGLTIFFFTGTAFTFFGRWRGWNDWRYFIIGALGVFFPLVFLASTLRMFIAGEGFDDTCICRQLLPGSSTRSNLRQSICSECLHYVATSVTHCYYCACSLLVSIVLSGR